MSTFVLTSTKDLIDQTIDEGNTLSADTRYANTWLIYNNSLPQW